MERMSTQKKKEKERVKEIVCMREKEIREGESRREQGHGGKKKELVRERKRERERERDRQTDRQRNIERRKEIRKERRKERR